MNEIDGTPGTTLAEKSPHRPIGDHLLDGGLGQVSEVFDGDPPHAPRGCPAQAWSVACVLEAWWRSLTVGCTPLPSQSHVEPAVAEPA